MKNYINLGNRISWGDKELVNDILSAQKDLDVLHGDGTYFNRAIEDNNHDIVQSLLSYFDKNQLSAYQEGSYEYSELRDKLQSILEAAIEEVDLSEEMKQALVSYIKFEDSIHSDFYNSSLGDNNISQISEYEENIHNSLKKARSTNDLNSTFEHSSSDLAFFKEEHEVHSTGDVLDHFHEFLQD
jgi:hypothetical protein